MVFTNEGFFQVAVECWSEWDFQPTTTEFSSHALTDFVQILRFYRFSSAMFHFGCCLFQSPRLFNRNFLDVIT